MKNQFLKVLFDKHILVAQEEPANQVEVLFALFSQLNIRVVEGFHLASKGMIEFAANQLGRYIPAPFYVGFPRTVRSLSPDQLLMDQLIHYTETYGFGDFETVGHSLFETAITRNEFNETEDPKDFRILHESAARVALEDYVKSLLDSSRPLNPEQKNVVELFMDEYKWMPKSISSKETAVELLADTKDIRFTKFLNLPDVIKLVDYINWTNHNSSKLNDLHLTSAERKFITKVLDVMLPYANTAFGPNSNVVRTCVEKRATWKGLLHNIHYCPKTPDAKAVVDAIYDDSFRSSYSFFEKAMSKGSINRGFIANFLKEAKGNATLIRNLNYLLSTCNSDEAVAAVLNQVDAGSPLVLMQMQNQYRNYSEGPRTFRFTKHNKVRTHRELSRNRIVPENVRKTAVDILEGKLRDALRNRLGKVYIAPGMENIAVPTNMSAGESGFGIMSTGSRIKLPKGKKIRAFTYWEKVNDIDLACFALDDDMHKIEFSWRTMYGRQSDAVTYSGDETSGFYGGSEYFDIDLDAFQSEYPDRKYIVFTNNVYSNTTFDKCVCRAGWMSRDVDDSGEIYEPKTVKSAYKINAESSFCYLYAIDVEKREVIWLNMTDAKNVRVAGQSEMDWLIPYFTICETMNMRKLFEYAASCIVSSPAEADLVVGDIVTNKPQIHSYDFEKTFVYLR